MGFLLTFSSAILFFLTAAYGQNYSTQTVFGRTLVTEGASATASLLRSPVSAATDSAGNTYIADMNDNRVWKVDTSGKITTFAGNGNPFYGGDNGPANKAALNGPTSVVVDSSNNVYIADLGNFRVREVTPDGIINTVAGSNLTTFYGDGGQATSAGVLPQTLALDKSGNLYISEGARIREVSAATGIIATIAGTGTPGYSGDGQAATAAKIALVSGMAVDPTGIVYLADFLACVVRRIDAKGVITTIGGSGACGYSGDGSKASTAAMEPYSLALDPAGPTLYLSEPLASTVRTINLTTGIISIFAGQAGMYGFGGDGGNVLSATLFEPNGLSLDSSKNLLICDTLNQRIRKVSTAFKTISTIAGISPNNFLNHPQGISLDSKGNLNIADTGNNLVKQLNQSTNTVNNLLQYPFLPQAVAEDSLGNLFITSQGFTSSAGWFLYEFGANGQWSQFGNGIDADSGDNGKVASASLGLLTSLAIDSSNNIYLADDQFYRIRKIDGNGNITLIAGSGSQAATGDGAKATAAGLDPFDIALDKFGNIYVADRMNNRVRKLTPGGNISTVAGTGTPGISGDNGLATAAMLNAPSGVAVDPAGNLYICDSNNGLLRKVTPDGIIHTIAGDGVLYPFNGDGPALQQNLNPYRVAVDSSGNIYLSDRANDRVRKLVVVNPASLAIAAGNNQTGNTAATLSQNLTVKVIGSDGNPYAGATVTFAVATGSATLTPATPQQTAFDGTASVAVMLGSTPGPVTVTATVAGLSTVTFNLTATAIAPASLTLVSGSGQSGTTGTPLPQKLIVKVTGSDNNPYAGATVTFTVASGSATLNPSAPQQTATDGTASASVTLGNAAGPITVTAGVAGLTTVTFNLTATAVAITPASLTIVSGSGQSGTVGLPLPQNLTVKVIGSDNNPYAGATVTFAVATGSATLNPSTPQQTAADGTASTSVTLGNTAGPVTVTASVAGLTAVTFSLTAAPNNSPQIFAGGVVSAGLSSPAIQLVSPNAIVSVFGQNFAPAGTSRPVTGSDLVNGLVPTNLAGVCVTFGAARAPIFLVTPGQLNIQVPQLPASGTVSVQVTTNCDTPLKQSTSNSVNVTVAAAAPEFFYSSNSGTASNPIAAIDPNGGGIGDPSRLGPGFALAYPGEIIQAFATGLGLSTPAFTPGQLPPTGAPVAGLTVTIDGTPLSALAIQYAGVAPLNAGLYQLNIALPLGLTPGDHKIAISVNGAASPSGAYLSVGPHM